MQDEVIGNFRVVERIGAGGMGEVWVAEQKDLGTRVAIKVLMDQISRDQDQVQRFFNEARAVSRIPHGGITKISDAGFTANGRAYLVMELLDGETLASLIQRERRLPLAQISEIGAQVANVLEATHKQGITHRDLKPDNIFIVVDAERASGTRVKILDFGIAKLTGTLGAQSPNTVGAMGTPAYMAPEQWGDAASVDSRADLYSLGCVIFEMATGRPPFVGAHFPDLFAKVTTQVAPRVSELAPGMPVALDALVARLLAKQPADRGGSMKQVEGELLKLGEGAVALAPIVGGTPSAQWPGVAPTLARDVATVPPVAATMAPDQRTLAPDRLAISPDPHVATVQPPLAPRSLAPTVVPAARRSKLPYALVGVALVGGAATAVVLATRHDDSTPSVAAAPADAAVAIREVPDATAAVAPDATPAVAITCGSIAAHVASLVKATDKLRPAAQGAIRNVLAAHCEGDGWDNLTLVCVEATTDARAVLDCMKALGKARFDAIGKDLAAESARQEADWVVVRNGTIALIEPIQLDGDAVREDSKPLVAALAQKVIAAHLKIELVGSAARTSAVRGMLEGLGVPADRARPVVTATDGVAIRLATAAPVVATAPVKPAPEVKPAAAPRVLIHETRIAILDQVHFANGASALDAAARQVIAPIAKVLTSHEELAVRIEGHIDSSEDKGLAILRARAVAAALVAAGVAKSRLTVHSYGPDKPIGDNSNESGRASNRRVEFGVVQ